MAHSISFTVSFEDEGLRLDALCANHGFYKSRSAAARFIEEGKVLVNGNVVAKKHLVLQGDTIVYEVEEEAVQTELSGQAIKLDIRYEDEHLLVISKQAGLVCHPSVDHYDGTLVNALIYHCGAENLCNVQGETDRLGIVHRLDQDTSGLMLAAKTDEAGYALMDAIRERVIERYYLALVHGNIAHETGMINAPLARAEKDRTRMAVRDTENARNSITTFKVLERYEAGQKDDGYTLVECKLFTGRTHQIRVHMQYIKHPCVGDQLYGSGTPSAQLGLERQFLHSYKLDFVHPITGKEMHFIDGLPLDLENAMGKISGRSWGRTDMGTEILGQFEQDSI